MTTILLIFGKFLLGLLLLFSATSTSWVHLTGKTILEQIYTEPPTCPATSQDLDDSLQLLRKVLALVELERFSSVSLVPVAAMYQD